MLECLDVGRQWAVRGFTDITCICVSFQRGDRYGDVECFNSGEVLAVISTGGDDTKVWEPGGNSEDALRAALSIIRTFVGC